jgi:hypothetical protein
VRNPELIKKVTFFYQFVLARHTLRTVSLLGPRDHLAKQLPSGAVELLQWFPTFLNGASPLTIERFWPRIARLRRNVVSDASNALSNMSSRSRSGVVIWEISGRLAAEI